MAKKPNTNKPTNQEQERTPEGRSLSLYEIESELTEAMATWLEADDHAQAGDAEAGMEAIAALNGLRQIVQTYLGAAKDKRDGVAKFMLHLETQGEFAGREIQRLQKKQRAVRNAYEHLKQYVVMVCESQGVTKLEGTTHTLSLRKVQDSIEVLDEKLVPERHLVPQPPKPDKRSIMEEYKLMDKARESKLAKDPNATVPWPSVPGTVRHQGKKTVVIR